MKRDEESVGCTWIVAQILKTQVADKWKYISILIVLREVDDKGVMSMNACMIVWIARPSAFDLFDQSTDTITHAGIGRLVLDPE